MPRRSCRTGWTTRWVVVFCNEEEEEEEEEEYKDVDEEEEEEEDKNFGEVQ